MTNFSALLVTRRAQALREARDAAHGARALADVAARLHTSLRTLQRLAACDPELAHVLAPVRDRGRRAELAARIRAARARGVRFTLAREGEAWLISRYDADGEFHVIRKDKVDAWAQIV